VRSHRRGTTSCCGVSDGACQQVLEHPGCVWSVAFLPNGDLLTACGDGIARVWTRDAARAAPADVQAQLDEALRAQKRRWGTGQAGHGWDLAEIEFSTGEGRLNPPPGEG